MFSFFCSLDICRVMSLCCRKNIAIKARTFDVVERKSLFYEKIP